MFLIRALAKPSLIGSQQINAARTLASSVANNPFSLGPAKLKLKSGQEFAGTSFGASKCVSGETVFTTSLVGYPESMTDPSYRGQILVFTQPLIGNYGVPAAEKDEYGLYKHFESGKIQCEAIVVSNYATHHSHWQAVESLGNWCARHDVPAITGVDTRALVHLLRDQGSTLGYLGVGKSHDAEPTFVDPNLRNLVAEASTKEPVTYNPEGNVHIAVVDCGIKQNIVRSLASRGATVTVVPWNYDFNKVADQFDGLFVSNGPGDPAQCVPTINHLREAFVTFADKPIFGICMGNQLMGLAAGLQTYKLPYGNRGHNQPAVNMQTGECVITSQNHGFALDDRVMPSGWERYFINANDGSNEGIRHKRLPFSSVQFHPEAKGGPLDATYLFDTFLSSVRAKKVQREGMRVFVGHDQKKQAAAV